MTTKSLKHIAPFLLAALGAVVLCVALYMIVEDIRNPPQNWGNPPIYPNAQNVRIEDVDMQGEDWGERIKKTITFETNDNHSDVLAFYAQSFGSEWQPSFRDIKENSIKYITFRGSRAPEMFTFEVSVNEPTVEIKLGYDPGR